MPYGQGSATGQGYYDSASGQSMDPNYGKGQMPGEVDPEDPYEVGHHDRQSIDYRAGNADEFSEGYYNQVAEGGGYGEAMLNKGLGQAQHAMQSQAVSRGANPMAERAAILGGGQMMRQGAVDASGIRAQEMAAAAAQRQAQMNQSVAIAQWHEQMERQRQMADQQHYGTMTGIEVAEDAQQANTAMQGVGMGMSAAGSAGMASDIKLKDGSCVPADNLADQAISSAAAEPEPAHHGVVIEDAQGYPTRYTSRFSTAGNSPVKDLGPRDADPVLPEGGEAIAGYRPAEYAGPVNGTPQGLTINPQVAEVVATADPMGEYGKLMAGMAANKSASDSGGGGGMGAAGGMLGGLVASDIRLKDGTCIPSSAVEDANIRMAAKYRQQERLTHEPMGEPGLTADDLIDQAARRRHTNEMLGFRWGPPRTTVSMNPRPIRQFDLEHGGVLTDPYQPYSKRMGTPEAGSYDQRADGLIADSMRGGGGTGTRVPQPREDYASLAAALDRAGSETDAELDSTSSHLRPKTWSYKPEAQQALGLPGGKRVGPMAQDLERSELGALAVKETPAGKMIDRDAALGLSLGLHGRHGERDDDITKRVSALEAALKREGKRTESKL